MRICTSVTELKQRDTLNTSTQVKRGKRFRSSTRTPALPPGRLASVPGAREARSRRGKGDKLPDRASTTLGFAGRTLIRADEAPRVGEAAGEAAGEPAREAAGEAVREVAGEAAGELVLSCRWSAVLVLSPCHRLRLRRKSSATAIMPAAASVLIMAALVTLSNWRLSLLGGTSAGVGGCGCTAIG